MRRIGMVLPSSNVVLEPAAARLGALDVSWHVARIGVRRLGLGPEDLAQFEPAHLHAAADLLADARVDATLFAATAGPWLGLDRDRELIAAYSERAGRPATTTFLALVERLRAGELERIALMTPFTAAMQERIVQTLAVAGIDVVAEVALGLEDNRLCAEITPETLLTRARALTRARSDAIVTFGTNLRAYEIDRDLAELAQRPVLDSVRVALDAGLALVGGVG